MSGIPNITGPRHRKKRSSILTYKFINEFIAKYPVFKDLKKKEWRKIVRSIIEDFHELIWKEIIENRNGVELPNGIGYCYVGVCTPKRRPIDHANSLKYNTLIRERNLNTDGKLGKICYTNSVLKYRFENQQIWCFEASRNFKRQFAKEFPENYMNYIILDSSNRIKNTFKKSEYIFKKKNIVPDDYEEFNI